MQVLFAAQSFISVLAFQAIPSSAWANLFWLVVIFLVVILLNRWITLHVSGLGLLISMNQSAATWIFFFLFFPGILIHEVSHYIVAFLLRANPSKLTLWPKFKRGRVVLGSVQVRNADPLVHSLVGVAPLVVGSLVVWLIARLLQFEQLWAALETGDTLHFFDSLTLSMTTPDFWLWLYLLFAIANAMLPSPADRVYWTPVLIFLGSIIVLLIGFNLLPSTMPIEIQNAFTNVISIFVFAFTSVIAVDLLFMFIIFLLEQFLKMITGRAVQY